MERTQESKTVKVSVCICTYNRASLLKESIESVLSQSGGNFEIVVVDDGSSDNTRAVVGSFGSPKIHYFKKTHSGAPESRNLAIRNSAGDYILWVGDDDIILPDLLKDYVAALEKYPDADILYCHLLLGSPDGGQVIYRYRDWYEDSRELLGNLIFKAQFSDGGTLFSKDVYRRIGFYNTRFVRAQDYEFASRVAAYGKFKLKLVDKPLYLYRMHDTHQLSGNLKNKDFRYDETVISSILNKFSMETLFPNVDRDVKRDETLSDLHFAISGRFLQLNALREGIRYLKRSVSLNSNPQRLKRLNELGLQLRDFNRRHATLSSKHQKDKKDADVRRELEALERIIKPIPGLFVLGSPGGLKDAKGHLGPLVSVIIPCFNQGVYLAEAVESVVRQTYTNWECIIVNDGSTDDTEAVSGQLASRFPDKAIRLVNKTNGGLVEARNSGIRASRGVYWLPLDADDMIAPEYLEKAVKILENRPEVGFVYSHIQHFEGSSDVYFLPEFDRETMIRRDNIACGCSLVRRSVWDEVGGYNPNMKDGYEDWDFWVGCLEKGWSGYRIPEALFKYRKRQGSMLSGANKKRNELIAQILLNHPSLYSDEELHQAEMTLKERGGEEASVRGTMGRAENKTGLRVTYLIDSILGITGGNQTLLKQTNALVERGHHVTIITYSPHPGWFDIRAEVIRIPTGTRMADSVPPSDVVISTYFTNTLELKDVEAPVKIYFAQGDQYIFCDDAPAKNARIKAHRLRLQGLSKASYLVPKIRFVSNSHNLAGAVERAYGVKSDAILPVCTDQTVFRPLERALPGSRWRILVVGPDTRGSETEPLTFKGMGDILRALEILSRRINNFTAVRISNTEPEIFKDFPCEFYGAPNDDLKTYLYGTAHILVYASHYDSCPRPPQEAMASGAAVVCTSTPGAMEYCSDGVNSLLVPVASPPDIANAVELLLKDKALREQLIQGGFETAKQYPREREWDELERCLFRFVKEAGMSPVGKSMPPYKESDEAYLRIQNLMDEGRGDAAICELEKHLESNPDSALAHNDLGVLLLNQGDKDKARVHYEQAVRLQPGNITFQKNLADYYYVVLGRVEEAMKRYVEVLSIDPTDIETLLILGHICVSLKRFDDAKVFYESVLKIEPWNRDARKTLEALEPDVEVAPCPLPDSQDTLVSIIVRVSGRHKYLRKCVESIKRHTEEPHEIIFLKSCPKGAPLKWLERIIKDTSNYQLIECPRGRDEPECYNTAIQNASGEYIALLTDDRVVTEGWLFGMLQCIQGTPNAGIVGAMTNAVRGIQKVSEVGALKPDRLDDYAARFREKNRHRRMIARGVADFCALFRRDLTQKVGPLDVALDDISLAFEDFCLRAALSGYKIFIAGDVFIYGNDTNTAEVNKKRLNEKWAGIDAQGALGKKILAFNTREKANELNEKGQMEEAVEMLLKGIKRFPQETSLFYTLAEILIDCKNFKNALDVLEKMRPDHLELRKLELTGYCKEGLELHEEAHEYADRALSLNAASSSGLNLMGMLAYARGDSLAAENFFKDATMSDPGYGEPYTNLGTLKWDAGEKETALEFYEKGFILSPASTDIATIYHSAVTHLEEFARAEPVFKDATALHPFNRRLKYLFIDVLLRQGKHHMAMGEIERAMVQFEVDDGFLSAALNVRNLLGPAEIDGRSNGTGTVSLCMIVKNEEQCLARCLLSVSPAADEMIVVDTGSGDRTKEIAKIFGAKVYDFEWNSDFSEARNFCITKASGRWVLVLDADEVISPKDYGRLKRITRSSRGNVGAYSFVTRNYTLRVNTVGWTPNDGTYPEEEAGTGWHPSEKVRLFPNDNRIQFENPVHELVEPSLERSDIRIRRCGVPIHHYGKLNGDRLSAKGKEYYRLGKTKVEEKSHDLQSLTELAVQAGELGEYEDAVDLWKRVADIKPDSKRAFVSLGGAYLELGEYENALWASRKAMTLDPDLKEAILNYAYCELFIGDVRKAISALETLVHKHPEYLSAIAILGAAYLIQGEENKGMKYIDKIGRAGFSVAEYLQNRSQQLMAAGRTDYALSVLEVAVKSGNVNEPIFALLAKCRQAEQDESNGGVSPHSDPVQTGPHGGPAQRSDEGFQIPYDA